MIISLPTKFWTSSEKVSFIFNFLICTIFTYSFISGYIGVSTSFYIKSMSGCAQFTNRNQVISVKMSFEKAFINQFLRIILSPCYWEYSPMKLWKKIFTLGLGPIFGLKNTVGKSLQAF